MGVLKNRAKAEIRKPGYLPKGRYYGILTGVERGVSPFTDAPVYTPTFRPTSVYEVAGHNMGATIDEPDNKFNCVPADIPMLKVDGEEIDPSDHDGLIILSDVMGIGPPTMDLKNWSGWNGQYGPNFQAKGVKSPGLILDISGGTEPRLRDGGGWWPQRYKLQDISAVPTADDLKKMSNADVDFFRKMKVDTSEPNK